MDNMCMGTMGHDLTRRMKSVVEGLRSKYMSLYNTEDFVSKIAYLEKCYSDEIGSIQTEIVQMFGKCGVNNVKAGMTPSYYYDVLKNSDIPTPEEMAHKVYESFYNEFKNNPFPLPEEYIERIVAEKIPKEWEGNSLRLKILKKFIKDAGALKAAGYKSLFIKQYIQEKTKMKNINAEDLFENLDDSIFKNLEGADNQQTRKSGKYGLLKIADDLANGRFGNVNVVREEIYIFAIVFELLYFTGDSEELITEEGKLRDIEKVMFGDYYVNNIMRHISDSHKQIRSGGEEQNPVGKGINYKNYMEAIFLYYMRRFDLSIEEKIKCVYAMAKEVHKDFLDKNNEPASKKSDILNVTQYYGNEFKKNVLETEDEFKSFILSIYDCSLPPETTPVFSAEIEQQSAADEYNLLLEDAKYYKVDDVDYEKEPIVFMKKEIDFERIKQIYLGRENDEISFETVDDKTKLDILFYVVNRDLMKKKSEEELEKKIVSRIDILRLFFRIYISMRAEEELDEEDIWKSFPEVCDDFSKLANSHLENALLNPIDGRNLYDLIIIYYAYCNVNQDKTD